MAERPRLDQCWEVARRVSGKTRARRGSILSRDSSRSGRSKSGLEKLEETSKTDEVSRSAEDVEGDSVCLGRGKYDEAERKAVKKEK